MITWLANPPNGIGEYLILILAGVTLILVIAPMLKRFFDAPQDIPDPLPGQWISWIWRRIVFCAGEEFVFRYLPLYASVEFLGFSSLVLVVAAASSLFFGIIHGFSFEVIFDLSKPSDTKVNCIRSKAPLYEYVIVHGLAGLILSLIFLKAGGFAGIYKLAFVVTTSVHFFVNLLFLVLRRIFYGEQTNSPEVYN